MKKILLTIISMACCVSSIIAQPSNVQKVSKSVFTLTTFNPKGDIIASTQGVFIDNKGTAISTFKPFIGASKATVIDANGRSMDVDAIMGADELYDVAKFRVLGNTTAANLSQTASPLTEKVWLVPYSIKKPSYQQEEISKIETFNNSYNYYIFANSAPENAIGCPFVNKNGQVIGLMNLNNGSIIAIDGNFAKQLKVTGLSSLDAALRESNIRTSLPETEHDAITMMTLRKSQINNNEYAKYINEFIEKFPTSAYGYKEKALMLSNEDKFDEASKCLEDGIKNAKQKDEAYSNYADIIYQKIVYKSDSTYKAWSLDKAIELANKAYNINALPIYKHQEAQILFYKGNYEKAYNLFMDLTKTSINSGELYYEAAQSKAQLNAPVSEIEVLLDSAVSVGKQKGIVAPYYLARAQFLDRKGDYRKAIQDYNQYDSLSNTTDPTFFYARYKCETKLRMWQPALLDIARTCYLAPKEPTYFAEWASLDLRVKRIEEGIGAAKICTQLAPEYPDGYLLLGLLQIENKQKEEGLKNLEKAKDLGDTRADNYIKKYK